MYRYKTAAIQQLFTLFSPHTHSPPLPKAMPVEYTACLSHGLEGQAMPSTCTSACIRNATVYAAPSGCNLRPESNVATSPAVASSLMKKREIDVAAATISVCGEKKTVSRRAAIYFRGEKWPTSRRPPFPCVATKRQPVSRRATVISVAKSDRCRVNQHLRTAKKIHRCRGALHISS